MAARKVLKLGDPVLRKVSQEITEDEIKTKEFKKIIKDMFDTMKFEGGVGLAAPQIGILKRLVVVGVEDSERYPGTPNIKDEILINPVITPLAPAGTGFWEGCLSVPGMRGLVERPTKIKIQWYDEKWKHYSEIVEGYKAIVFQHECDHLNGILYVDRLKDIKLFGYTDTIDTQGNELD